MAVLSRAREGRLKVRLHAELTPVFFLSLPSPFRGCRPRIGYREWVERVGGGLCVFSWRTNSARTDTCLLARSGTSSRVEEDSLHQHQEEGPASPGEPDSPSSCSPVRGRCSGRCVSLKTWFFGLFISKFIFWSGASFLPDTGQPFWQGRCA